MVFVVAPAYSTWTLSKIQADMRGSLPDEFGRLWSVSKDDVMQKILNLSQFSIGIVDAEPVVFCDLDKSLCISGVRNYLMITKWFSIVDYTYQGKRRLKREQRLK